MATGEANPDSDAGKAGERAQPLEPLRVEIDGVARTKPEGVRPETDDQDEHGRADFLRQPRIVAM